MPVRLRSDLQEMENEPWGIHALLFEVPKGRGWHTSPPHPTPWPLAQDLIARIVRSVRDPCVPSGPWGARCAVLQAPRTPEPLPLHYLEVPHLETESTDRPSQERCPLPPVLGSRQSGGRSLVRGATQERPDTVSPAAPQPVDGGLWEGPCQSPLPQVGRSRDSWTSHGQLPLGAQPSSKSGSGLQSWIQPCRLEEQEELLVQAGSGIIPGTTHPTVMTMGSNVY